MIFATKPWNIVHHSFSMLLHYLGKLEVQIWSKLHCALKTRFMLLALTRWNLNWFSQFFFTAPATVNTFSSVKKMKSVANWQNFFRTSLPAVQFASVSSCARRLLKHFSCRSFRIMQTTDDLGIPVSRDISRTVLWVRVGPLDSEPYRSPGQCFHSCRHFAVCRCPDIWPLCLCFWTSSVTC